MRIFVIAGLTALVAGCGPQGTATYPVHGKVVFGDGSPLRGGTIEFRNVTKRGKPIVASGIVGEDGTFELTTFGNKKGAVVGTHQVIVFPKRTLPSAVLGIQPLQRPAIDPRFFSYKTSGLEVTVTEGENDVDIPVERPAGHLD